MNHAPCNGGTCIQPARQPGAQTIAWEEQSAPSKSQPIPVRTQAKASPRVLVVDDDILFRTLNTQVLSRAGYAVDSVENGAAAWEALNANRYDLMVTDNSMPNISGVELLRKLYTARIDLPVIMAASAIPAADLNYEPAVQPMATLVKPYPTTELVRTVKAVLHEAQTIIASFTPTTSQNQTCTE